MKKVIYNLGFFALMGAGVLVNAQENTGRVGINVGENPQATLDVQPTTANLKGTTNEGFIAPKLTKERVANIATPIEGTLVYVSKLAYTGNKAAVAKIDSKGYYYFDGTEWVKAKGTKAQAVGVTNGLSKDGENIKLGGVLSEDTNIVLNNKYSFFLSRYDRSPEDLSNQGLGFYSMAEGNKLKSYSAAEASKPFSFDVQTDNEYTTPYGNANRLYFNFNIQGNEKLRITYNGLGVGTSDVTAKLDVNGNARIRTIEEGNPGTDYVVLADKEGYIKKAAAGSLGKSYEGSTSIVLNKTSFERAALTGDITSAQNSNEVTVNAIQGKSISNTAPTNGQVLKWNETNSKWEPSTDTDSGAMLTANNGLTKTGDNIELGGTLTKSTNIDQAGNNFTITKGYVGINVEDPQNQLSVNGVSGSGNFFTNNAARAIYTGVTGGAGTIGQYIGFGVYKKQYDDNNFLSVADREEALKQRFVIWNAFYEGGSRVFFSPFTPEKGNEEQEFNVAGNSALTILQKNKNIGIGTNDPTVKLDINGNVKIRSIATGNPDTDYVVLADTYGNIKKASVTNFKGPKGDTGETGAQGPAGVAGPQGPSGVVAGANGITYEESSKTVSLPQGTNGQVLKWEDNAWKPANVNTKNLYTDNGNLTENRTVDLANHSLILGTGGNNAGKVEINGTKVTKGAVYVNMDGDTPNFRTWNGNKMPEIKSYDYMIIFTNNDMNGKLTLPLASESKGRILHYINGTLGGLTFLPTDDDNVITPFNYTVLNAKSSCDFISDGVKWYPLGR